MKTNLKLFLTLILVILISLLMQTSVFAFPSLIPVETKDSVITNDSIIPLIYEVDTVAAGINRANQLTVDKNGNIYYIDFCNDINNKLMGIIDGVTKVIADGGIEKTRVLDLINIVYDKEKDRVLLLCNVNSGYYTYNSEFIGTSAIYDISDLSAPIAIFKEGYFTFFCNPIMLNGMIINNGLRFDLVTSSTTIFGGGYYAAYTEIIKNQYITFDGTFRKFDLSLNTEIDIPVNLTSIPLVNSISSYNNKFYLYSKDSGSFYEVNINNDNPEAKPFITGSDLIINDFLPFTSVDVFTLTNDGSIIFYDGINKAIRKISVQ